jgi:adenine-specific DNA-methyltransferase
MPDRIDQREALATVLKEFDGRPVAEIAKKLFAALGYESNRRLPISTAKQFCTQLDPGGRLTERERETLDQLTSLHLLFQLTDGELADHVGDTVDDGRAVEATKIESYLFFAAELPSGHYTRTALSTLVRAINKPLPMPALVMIRHGDTVSVGIIHRRLHRRDQARDILEKITLIKDIAFADPIRAHLEILNDFALANLAADFGVSNFVRLHEAWQKRLGSYALSNEFYREIADWYFWAHHQVDDGTIRLPLHCDTEQEKSLFLIRLLTRVIFSWFLVEKRLIPTDLFREHRLKTLLREFTPSRDPKEPDTASSYYHAVLQNLFFGTLNMPPEQRAFRERKKEGERYDPNFGITNLWRYEGDFRQPTDWLDLAARVPFLNGGLFDCLDDKSGKNRDNFILDGFSDRTDFGCDLPNDLFFGTERTVDLSKDYGEEDKRTARSKRAKVRGLIEILSRYKFTIEENTPLEEEIALDPELLGKVFENLLASYNEDTSTTARKALGAFYTPREIVGYMVDEALKSFLTTQVPRCKGTLEDLFSNKATLKEIKPDTRDALIAAIGRVKILDPACGSGAFPMGALHRLVDLLQKLDPNNESWKRDRLAQARRYRQLLEESGAAKEEIAACDARIADIEKSFDTRFHALDFARKLYLIENSIYGVDIQPIATQIAKLRFFISLVVDQKVEPKAPNLGVRPLPNLETRLVAADTLIPIGKSEDDLLTGELDKLRAELTAIRHEHFNARSPATKRKWRAADEAKRGEIADLLERNHALPRASARKLAAWDPYDQNEFARFFDSEWMFGLPIGKVRIQGKAPATLLGNLALINEAGGQSELTASTPREIDSGFDIVIGNPPYIRIQTLKQKDPDIVAFYKDHYASAAKGNYDIYVVFIEAGLRLLKSDGHLAYICPHKFFNAQYGEPIREVIAKGKHLRHVVHFGDEQVFPGATIYSCLLFLANSGSNECRFVKANDLEAWKTSAAAIEGKIPATAIKEREWNFAVGKGAGLFDALNNGRTKLGEVADSFVGLQTSADDVFILQLEGTSDQGVALRAKALNRQVVLEVDLLHPLVSGTDVKSYAPLPSRQYIIFPYDIRDSSPHLISLGEIQRKLPKTARYLVENKERLESRENGKLRNKEWHGYIYLKNMAKQGQPKVCVPRLVDHLHAGIDLEGTHYLDNVDVGGVTWKPAYSARSLKTLCALLNSQVLRWFFPHVSAPFRGGFRSANRQFLEQVPICETTQSQETQIDQIVDLLLFLNRHFANHAANQTSRDPLMLAYWERMLNGLVYELFFPDEVHGAGLHLFDLVAQAQLPAPNTIPETQRLPRLRTLFEALHDGAHPLRIALDKLQTLDSVRIIEGKA